MNPPAHPFDAVAVDLQGFTDKEYAAIKNEAARRGVSLDEAAKLLLLEHARKLRARSLASRIAQLFRIGKASHE